MDPLQKLVALVFTVNGTRLIDPCASEPPKGMGANFDAAALSSYDPTRFYMPTAEFAELADVAIIVEGARLPAHKQVG